jgi:hypothetical protein
MAAGGGGATHEAHAEEGPEEREEDEEREGDRERGSQHRR